MIPSQFQIPKWRRRIFLLVLPSSLSYPGKRPLLLIFVFFYDFFVKFFLFCNFFVFLFIYKLKQRCCVTQTFTQHVYVCCMREDEKDEQTGKIPIYTKSASDVTYSFALREIVLNTAFNKFRFHSINLTIKD